MYRKGWPAFVLMLALCSVGLAVGFTFTDTGIRWFWADAPWVSAALLVGSAACWGFLLLLRRQHRAQT